MTAIVRTALVVAGVLLLADLAQVAVLNPGSLDWRGVAIGAKAAQLSVFGS